MSIQKLHYENLGGMLIRREGLLNWRCPLCKAEGQSPEVMRVCPECGSKEATLPGAQAQPAPSVPEGWKLVPIEPTEKMINEGTCAATLPGPHYIDSACAKQCWTNMLAAAPEPKS